MTETEASTEPSPAQLNLVKRRLGLSALAPFLAIIFIAALYFGAWLVWMHMMSTVTVAPSSAALVLQMEQRVTNIEQKVQALDSRLNELSARVDKNSPISVSTELPDAQSVTAPPVATAQTVAHMQNDLTALSATLTALQAEVKKTGSAATETQQTTQTALAATIAFIQLHETADAGRGFSHDLTALRAVVGNRSRNSEITRATRAPCRSRGPNYRRVTR